MSIEARLVGKCYELGDVRICYLLAWKLVRCLNLPRESMEMAVDTEREFLLVGFIFLHLGITRTQLV